MQSLWPDQIFSSPHKSLIVETLEVQADALTKLSNGELSVAVLTSNHLQLFSFKFMVAPRGQDDQAFELFVVRCEGGAFPCVVQDYHTGLGLSAHLKTESEFSDHLTRLFSHPRTLEILQILRGQFDAALDATPGDATILAEIQPHRFTSDIIGDRLVKMRIRDFVGYLRADEIVELLGSPDGSSSNYKLLKDDQYQMFIEFAGPIALPVSRAEIDALQASVKAALIEWAADAAAGFDE